MIGKFRRAASIRAEMEAGGVQPYRARMVDEQLARWLQTISVVELKGPRGIGKTRAAVQVAESVIDLSIPEELTSFSDDRAGFLRAAPKPLLIDEHQHDPHALWALKSLVDREGLRQVIVAGSVDANELNINEPNPPEPLAMRSYTLHVEPMTVSERHGTTPQVPLLDLLAGAPPETPSYETEADDYLSLIVEGGYPAASGPNLDDETRRAYLISEANRTVRTVASRHSQDNLRRYVRTYARLAATFAPSTTLAEAARISRTSAVAYRQLIAAARLTAEVPSWGRKLLAGRFIKQPKLMMRDTGMFAAQIGANVHALRLADDHRSHALETLVAAELRPHLEPGRMELFHYRDNNKVEIDLVLEDYQENRSVGFEVKSARGVTKHDARHLVRMRDAIGDEFAAGFVLYRGRFVWQLFDRIYAAPISILWS